MLLNYLKSAVRQLTRNPFFAFINVLGLAIGFASFFALWQFATSELKSDQFHDGYERMARVGMKWKWTEDEGKNWDHLTFSVSKSSLLHRFQEDFPEVESILQTLGQPGFWQQGMAPLGDRIVAAIEQEDGGERTFKETKVTYADSNYFEFFSIPLIYGLKENVLSEANDVALSQSTSTRYFGKRDPRGELLRLNDSTLLRVTGVYKDLPYNTHLDPDMVICNKGIVDEWRSAWLAFTHNYVKLRPGTSLVDFEQKLKANTERYFGENHNVMATTRFELFVIPLDEIVYCKNYIGDDHPVRSKAILLAFLTASVVVLIMGWGNYINLSVCQASRRMKEFAARKANGAQTLDLIRQLLVESALVNIISIVLALTLLQIVRQPLALYLNIHIGDLWSMDTGTMILFALVILSGILLTGVYPALFSLRHQQGGLFKIYANPENKKTIPAVLTTMQFTAAIALIMWGYTVFMQLNYILNKDTGYNKDNVVVVESPILKTKSYEYDMRVLMNTMQNSSAVAMLTGPWKVPNDPNPGSGDVRRIGSDLGYGMQTNGVDENFIPFFEVRLLAGRNFIKDDRKDVIILSRSALLRIGFNDPEKAVGEHVIARLGEMSEGTEVEIVGVVEDYRLGPYFNLDGAQGPDGGGILLSYKNTLAGNFVPEKIALRVTGDLDQALPDLEASFNAIFPGNAFSWYFLDDSINQAYGSEKTARNQIMLFTALAIGIACLGLLGMVTNKVIEKTKEIGIRKVLGARSVDIGAILLNTTFRQFIFSALLGLPLSWYLTTQYLQKYSEHIALQWWHYAIPLVLLLGIMFSTITSALLKAVRTNPVDSLRYE